MVRIESVTRKGSWNRLSFNGDRGREQLREPEDKEKTGDGSSISCAPENFIEHLIMLWLTTAMERGGTAG